jgi:hypothetical protein
MEPTILGAERRSAFTIRPTIIPGFTGGHGQQFSLMHRDLILDVTILVLR